mgnify:CR=1 FL=1
MILLKVNTNTILLLVNVGSHLAMAEHYIYIRLVGDLDMMQDECKYADVWEDGDKIRCIDGSKQKTLELGKVYTVDTSMNTTEDRVYIKENKRFSFLKSRFKLVEG